MDKKNDNSLKHYFKKFWNYLWYDDSIGSYILNFIVALVFIKFIFFPGLGLLLGTNIPVVAVVSGSMEHEIDNGKICGNSVTRVDDSSVDVSTWWSLCGSYYEDNLNISEQQFKGFDFTNGLNIGDVIILTGRESKEIDIGDVLVFVPGNERWYMQNGPVIHRVVDKEMKNGEYVFTTKGDNNPSIAEGNFERDITQEQILAVAQYKIPYVGYLKVALVRILGVFS